jgi:hypothetical protein
MTKYKKDRKRKVRIKPLPSVTFRGVTYRGWWWTCPKCGSSRTYSGSGLAITEGFAHSRTHHMP